MASQGGALEAEAQVGVLSGEWSFSSAPCVGIVIDRTVPALSRLACFFFCSHSEWIEYFLTCVGSILSFPSVFPLTSPLPLVCLVWSKIIQSSHLHTPPTVFCFLHFSLPLTLLSSSSSPLIALLCGCVCLGVFPLPPLLPLMVKERMRLEREEATRLLEEETEVRHSSSEGLQTNFVSVQKAPQKIPQHYLWLVAPHWYFSKYNIKSFLTFLTRDYTYIECREWWNWLTKHFTHLL